MQRPIFYLLVLCIFLGAALIGYGQWTTPSPAATATPTNPSRPPATRTLTPPAVLTADRIVLAPFTITLPTPWFVLRPTDQTWASQLQQIAAKQPMLTYYLNALATTPAVEHTLALFWLPASPPALSLVAAVIPAEGLTLQRYLAAATEELAQSRLLLGTAVIVKKAEIRYDLHPEHIPIALLQYTLPSDQNVGAAGYQAVMIDKTGAQLLLLTAITHDPDPTAAFTLVDAIVAAVQEE